MRATSKAHELRRKVSREGEVDVEAAANMLGLEVIDWPLSKTFEVKIPGYIAVAERLSARWRRWSIAHALGHQQLHCGNHMWMRLNTMLTIPLEREAEEFAYALLVDEDEARRLGMTEAWEIAEHFGIPEEVVRVQGRLRME